MRGPAGRCPNCSAPLRFRWSSAVQTTCDACRSVVVRHDVDVEAVGEVADLPPDSSPIQIGTAGQIDGRAFTVVGRIVYEYDDGTWNEWHLAYADGASGWLSDAQLEYAVSGIVVPDGPLPAAFEVRVGQPCAWGGRELQVTTLTRARYRGVEGDLPFQYWGKAEVLFADLRSADAAFGTLDYSDVDPLLFVGRLVTFDELHLRNLRTFEGEDRSSALRGLNCVHCGAAIELRALTHTRTVACASCGSQMDPAQPSLAVLQDTRRRKLPVPLIPLGTRGTWHGQPFDVIGFQQRSIEVDGTHYGWDEYVLFNPYHGFRYLTYYNGHWNDVEVLRALPEDNGVEAWGTWRHAGHVFTHFQNAMARTDVVIGEFPWRVRVGDVVETDDHVAPPLMLSSEKTDQERTWSLGRYTAPEDVQIAFGLVATPEPLGVFANQPNPYARFSRVLVPACLVLWALTLLVALGRQVTAANEVVFEGAWTYRPGVTDDAFVTPTFPMRAPGTVGIALDGSVENAWLACGVTLVNAGTGAAHDVGAAIEYYRGVDQGEPWSEGTRATSVSLPRLPAGEYYLRVEPEGPERGAPIPYRLTVRRDVPAFLPYLLPLVALPIVPLWMRTKWRRFEAARDSESDYGTDYVPLRERLQEFAESAED